MQTAVTKVMLLCMLLAFLAIAGASLLPQLRGSEDDSPMRHGALLRPDPAVAIEPKVDHVLPFIFGSDADDGDEEEDEEADEDRPETDAYHAGWSRGRTAKSGEADDEPESSPQETDYDDLQNELGLAWHDASGAYIPLPVLIELHENITEPVKQEPSPVHATSEVASNSSTSIETASPSSSVESHRKKQRFWERVCSRKSMPAETLKNGKPRKHYVFCVRPAAKANQLKSRLALLCPEGKIIRCAKGKHCKSPKKAPSRSICVPIKADRAPRPASHRPEIQRDDEKPVIDDHGAGDRNNSDAKVEAVMTAFPLKDMASQVPLPLDFAPYKIPDDPSAKTQSPSEAESAQTGVADLASPKEEPAAVLLALPGPDHAGKAAHPAAHAVAAKGKSAPPKASKSAKKSKKKPASEVGGAKKANGGNVRKREPDLEPEDPTAYGPSVASAGGSMLGHMTGLRTPVIAHTAPVVVPEGENTVIALDVELVERSHTDRATSSIFILAGGATSATAVETDGTTLMDGSASPFFKPVSSVSLNILTDLTAMTTAVTLTEDPEEEEGLAGEPNSALLSASPTEEAIENPATLLMTDPTLAVVIESGVAIFLSTFTAAPPAVALATPATDADLATETLLQAASAGVEVEVVLTVQDDDDDPNAPTTVYTETVMIETTS